MSRPAPRSRIAAPKAVSDAPERSYDESSARVHRQALADAIAHVRRQLDRTGKIRGAKPSPPPAPPPAESALARAIAAFGLTSFETSLLVLAVGVELEPAIAKACATANGDPLRGYPTLGLGLSLLDEPHWDALAPDRPLRRDRLVVLGDGEVLTQRRVAIDERVLHALMGLDLVDPRLVRRTRPLAVDTPLATSHERLVVRIASTLADARAPLVQLVAEGTRDAVLVAARAWHHLGKAPRWLGAADIPLDPADRDELSHIAEREARLAGVALVLDLDDSTDRAQQRGAIDFAARTGAPLLLVGRDPVPVLDRPIVRARVPAPSFEESIALWRSTLQGVADPGDEVLGHLVAQFRLDADAVRGVATELAVSQASGDEANVVLWRACRAQARPRLEHLAQRIQPNADFERLVLPAGPMRALRALVGQVRHKARVHHGWGLAAQSDRGHGTSAIFAGPSGTGKTMAAEAVAAELHLDLFRIDLSAVVSKYIGETEENLRRVFDAAESGGAILLFDEADSLFGKRTEVKDSHDRHANIEVSYLLQRMESYGGLSILTTNMRKAIDDAFMRRVQFVVEFPFPDAPLREQIWRGIFPREMPLSGVDYGRLAQLSVAGGNIRSIARNAAYLAADGGESVDMGHLLEAARLEYGKLARPLPPHETKGWEA